MKVIALAGWSGAGKTTLLTRLIPFFTAQGLRVSTLKRAHHSFDIDVPGKDSWVHRQSGATEVLISSGRRWALLHELRGEHEQDEPELGPVTSHRQRTRPGSRAARCDALRPNAAPLAGK